MKKIKNEDGLTVGDLIDFLQTLPKDAEVCINKRCRIANPEDDGSYTIGWVFDNFYEADYVERAFDDTDYIQKTCYFNTFLTSDLHEEVEN